MSNKENKEFIKALNFVSEDKGISKEEIIEEK